MAFLEYLGPATVEGGLPELLAVSERVDIPEEGLRIVGCAGVRRAGGSPRRARPLLLRNGCVSSHGHCRVWSAAGRVFVRDLGYDNGTWVSDTGEPPSLPIPPGEDIELRPGARLWVATARFRLGPAPSGG